MTHYLDMWAIGLIPEKWVIDRLLLANQVDQYEIIKAGESTNLVGYHTKIKIYLNRKGEISLIS